MNELIIHRPHEIEVITRGLSSGYGWAYGLHGIGKTTLVKKCIESELLVDYDFRYVDSRAEFHGFPDLTCSLLTVLGQKYSENSHENHRLLKSLFENHPTGRRLRIIIDELDVYAPPLVRPVWDLALAKYGGNLGLFFISARPIKYFEDPDDLSSKPMLGGEIQLYPLPVEATYQYFKGMQIPHTKTDALIRMSGGNPTLMKILAQMYLTSKDTNVFSSANRHFLTSIFSYFSNLWNALEEETKTHCMFAAILFFNYANNTKHWQMLRRNIENWAMNALTHQLRHMISFGDSLPDFLDEPRKELPSIVSPVFITWLLV